MIKAFRDVGGSGVFWQRARPYRLHLCSPRKNYIVILEPYAPPPETKKEGGIAGGSSPLARANVRKVLHG